MADKNVSFPAAERAGSAGSKGSSVKKGNGAKQLAFPPEHYLYTHSVWKDRVQYKRPPGNDHTMRTRLQGTVEKPLTQATYTELRDTLGDELFQTLQRELKLQSAGHQSAKGKALPSIGKTDGQEAPRVQTVFDKVAAKEGWKGDLQHVDLNKTSAALAEANRLGMQHRPLKGLRHASIHHKSNFPMAGGILTFDDWFESMGTLKQYKFPQAKVIKYGSSWHPRDVEKKRETGVSRANARREAHWAEEARKLGFSGQPPATAGSPRRGAEAAPTLETQ